MTARPVESITIVLRDDVGAPAIDRIVRGLPPDVSLQADGRKVVLVLCGPKNLRALAYGIERVLVDWRVMSWPPMCL